MAPRVHHFIVRPEAVKRLPTGLTVEQSLVPLVPLDELPEWLDIIHVPRSLTPEQTVGLTNLGCYERRGVHEVEIIVDDADLDASDTSDARTEVAAGAVTEESSALVSQGHPQPGLQQSRWADCANDDGLPGKPDSLPATTPVAAVHPADRMTSHVSPAQVVGPTSPASAIKPMMIPSTTGAAPSPSDDLRKSSDASPKKRAYCRHWIHHGTCKWGPYCRFNHKMPASLTGLAEVGLRDFPSWWTAAMALSLAAPPRRKVHLPYHRVDMRTSMRDEAMGYGYGCGYDLPGYGSLDRAGRRAVGYGGLAGGYGRVGYVRKDKEREVHPRERVMERKTDVVAGPNGGLQAVKPMGETASVGDALVGQGSGQGRVPAQTTTAVRAPASARRALIADSKSREGLEQQLGPDAKAAQAVPQHATQQGQLVDI